MKRWAIGLAVMVGLSSASVRVPAAIFFDDFNDGNADGWVFPHNRLQSQYPGIWSVEDGALIQHTGSDWNVGLVHNLSVSDQVVEARISRRGYAGLVLWYNQGVEGEWASYVAVNHSTQGELRVHDITEEGATKTSYTSPWIGGDTWFDLRVEADSATGTLAVYLDDVYMCTHTVSIPQRSGLSGVWSGNGPSYFDDFRLTSDGIAPIPEPCTFIIWSLLGTLALTVGWWRRRRAA